MSLERATDQADYDTAMRQVHETVSQLQIEHHEELPMWVVFGPGTIDQPGLYLARLWLTLPQPRMTNVLIRAGSLAEIHRLLPDGLNLLPRSASDDPNIIETFI
jgi:hypothetical protein